MERHHIFWPRKAYRRSRVAWKFRNLPCQVIAISHKDHIEIHKTHRETPGGMPSVDEMYRKIQQCLACGGCDETAQGVEVYLQRMRGNQQSPQA